MGSYALGAPLGGRQSTAINRVKRVIFRTTEERQDDQNVDDTLLREMVKLKVKEVSIVYEKEKAAF